MIKIMAITKGIQCAYCTFTGEGDYAMKLHYASVHSDEKEKLEQNERVYQRRHETDFNIGY